jgi:hypothetical protein
LAGRPLRFRGRRNFLGSHQGGKLRVGNHFYSENRLPALDFVAVGEHGVLDARAI